ncbi:MAG: glycosyltransferase family 2 protein [Candidatus Omnitrophica bacterium]|nr:glycosyltransferase family 2 protein [Candidatus Omnitrophota bacterium]
MSEHADPLVSVVMPTYNRAGTIERAVKSVLLQTYKNCELIIVDDGSKDDTENIVARFKSEKVKYFKNDRNRGVVYTRNFGIKEARGEYVAFLDSDDEWFAEKIEKQLNKALEIEKPLFVFCNGYCEGTEKKYAWDLNINSTFLTYNEKVHPLKQSVPPPSCWFISRDVFEKIGLFDGNLYTWEDPDLVLRMFLGGINIYFLNELLLEWHKSSNNLSSINEKLLGAKEVFLKKHLENMRKDKDYIYRFFCSMAKDYLKLGDKKKSRKYLLDAFKTNPYKISLLKRFLKTI